MGKTILVSETLEQNKVFTYPISRVSAPELY